MTLPITTHLFSGQWIARAQAHRLGSANIAETRPSPELAAMALARRLLRINARRIQIRANGIQGSEHTYPCHARKRFVAIVR
jgi:hypothetical protein